MKGHSSFTPIAQPTRRSRIRAAIGTPSMRTAITVFITLLILFRWLHLILALQTASTGRQIQIRTADMHTLERQNAILQQKISEEASPWDLADRAQTLNYRPAQLKYLAVDLPLSPSGDNSGTGPFEDEILFASNATAPSFWDTLAQGFDGWQEAQESLGNNGE